MARYKLSAVRAMAARCKLPFALRPDLSQASKRAPRRLQRKDKGPQILLLFRGRYEGGRGEEQRLFLTPGTQFLGLHPPLLFSFSPLPEFSL
jgi:hypothetical protein